MFRYKPDRPVPFVDLRGEMADFGRPLPLAPAGGGWLERTERLPIGTYAYKLRLGDGTWVLDPENARTRAWDGVRNSLLVVGGADEPLLHAPALPWLCLEDDGRLAVRAGLRRGAARAMRVRWDEGGETRETQMIERAAEDEHVLFEALLPVSARAVEYLFVLDDGRAIGAAGGAAQAFRVALRSLRRATPEWWKDAVVYTVLVDRFRRAGSSGTWAAPVVGGGEDARAGGDLDGVIEGLDHLERLGVTALHLTPIALAPSAHRYDAIDPRVVDPLLGGEDALVRLLDAAHRRGMRVLLDVTVTHVDRDFFAFRDVRERGEASPYWRWFDVWRWPFTETYDPGYAHYQKGRWQEPMLRTDEPEVADYLAGTFEHWTKLGADGFRVDAAADVPPALLARIGAAVRAIREDAVVFGEVIPEHLHRYLAHGLDAATDFAVQEALYDLLLRGRGARRASAVQARRRFARGTPAYCAIGFVGTHDQHRFGTLSCDARKTRLAHLLVLTRPEIPAIYQGDEVGLRADGGGRDFEGVWPDRMPMVWAEHAWDRETLELIRSAVQLRRERVALRRGDDVALPPPDDSTLAFRRIAGEEIVDVLLHAGDGEVVCDLPRGAPSHATVDLAVGEVELDRDERTVRLGPWSGAVILRSTPPAIASAWSSIVDRTSSVAREAFADGRIEVPALPSRLYVTVTEACNLRCAHCITLAPERTRGGRARELRPWVLAALREAFAAASYFGFSHGGESLVSAALFDALGAIQRARAGRPGRTDVHLLTNGMLLDAETTLRLAGAGVTSLAVSLDGATAATNDRVRLGGRFDTIVRNVRSAVELRSTRRLDLRVGVSVVAGRFNAGELPQFAALARDLGIDWLKIEETFPATPFARHELIRPDDARLLDATRALRESLAGSGVVLVDHLAPPSGCTAIGSPELRAFRDADDFANRATFEPCRMPWEQACVDPDGTVHPIDYHHPALGSLSEAPLLDLWNGPVARRFRADTVARMSPEARERCVGARR